MQTVAAAIALAGRSAGEKQRDLLSERLIIPLRCIHASLKKKGKMLIVKSEDPTTSEPKVQIVVRAGALSGVNLLTGFEENHSWHPSTERRRATLLLAGKSM